MLSGVVGAADMMYSHMAGVDMAIISVTAETERFIEHLKCVELHM